MNQQLAELRAKHWGSTQEETSKVWLKNYGRKQ